LRRVSVGILIVVLSALPASCGGGDSKLRVFAAASLIEAFDDSTAPLRSRDPRITAEFTFAGSSTLVQQIIDGADADVFASADEANMRKLVDAGRVETPRVFAHNILQIAVAPGNPKNIKTLADLERHGVVLVLADGSVPAGSYALQAFARAGLPVPEPRSLELDVKAVLTKLTTGEADAVVAYQTDVKAAGSQVQGVPIPDDDNVVTTYPIAIVKDGKHRADAEAFVNEAVSGRVQQQLQARGFLAP
jgi:molybdate transport system substrate-binding protein